MSEEWAVAFLGRILGTYSSEARARAEWARFPDVRVLLHREVAPWRQVEPDPE